MAKVKSMPSMRSSLNLTTDDLGNDAFSRLFSFDDFDESPPKYNDPFEISLTKQPSDKGYLKKNELSTAVSKHHIPSKLSNLVTDNDISVLELLQEPDTLEYNSEGTCLKLKFGNAVNMAPNKDSCDMVLNDLSLSALAENHLKLDQKSQASKDLIFDKDFSFSDLLYDIGDPSLAGKSPKAFDSNESSNLFGSGKNDNFPKVFTEPNRNTVDDDLSILLESCEAHSKKSSSYVSLSDLANSHFLADLSDNLCGKLGENLTEEVKNFGNCDDIDYELPGSLKDILSFGESEVILKGESTLADIVNAKISVDEAVKICDKDGKIDPDIELDFLVLSDVLKVENPVNKTLESCGKGEILSINDSSDNEIVPDIDLSFCVKKHKNTFNEKFNLTSTSPESTDSGFDETNFISLNNSPVFRDFVSFESASQLHDTNLKSPLINARQSLFSEAISCKVKSSKTKSEKLKLIKKDLFKKHFPSAFIDSKEQCPEIYKRIEDRSNWCAISCI